MLHVIGIVGLPASYGGFETLVDNLLDSDQIRELGCAVYCEKSAAELYGPKYKGADLIPISWRANGWQSIIHDSCGLWRASIEGGVILVLGTSATFWLPLFRRLFPRTRYIVNMAGLEWARSKWNRIAKAILRYNEACAVRYAHVLIADNQGLIEYVKTTYGTDATLIAYGGNQFQIVEANDDIISELSLPTSYDFAMARSQPDNNMEMILSAYAESGHPLVFVSNWQSSAFGREMLSKYDNAPNIHLIGPVYEPARIKALHQNVRMYVHGHSAGGTNPVLVEAMWAGFPTAAFDVQFNRFTTHNSAYYFDSKESLKHILRTLDLNQARRCGAELRKIAETHYTWERIRTRYEAVITNQNTNDA